MYPQIAGGEVGTEGQPVSLDGKDGDMLSTSFTPETSSLVFQSLEHVTVLTGRVCACVCAPDCADIGMRSWAGHRPGTGSG